MAYRVGRFFAQLALFFLTMYVVAFVLANFDSLSSKLWPPKPQQVTTIVSFVGMAVSMIGTASTILLGWRADHRQAEADRRQAEEAKLKIMQLEIELKKLQGSK